MMLLVEASKLAGEVDRTFWWVGAVTLALLLINTVAMVYFAIRYRRSRRPTVSQLRRHTLLEVVWIVVPTLIVCWMFTIGVDPFEQQRNPPANAYLIQVTGRQWAWSFHYPEAGFDTTELTVPVNVPVKLELNSADVIHGFYIPDFRVKEDVVPGQQNHMWFQADHVGVFNIFCSQFCGKDHSEMHTLLRVVSASEYDEFVRGQIARRFRPLVFEAVENPSFAAFGPKDLNIDGKVLFNTFCEFCHGAAGDGSGLPGLARNFTSPAGWKRSPKATDIFRTLEQGIPGTQMRPFPNLSPYEKVALAHYVRAFLKGQAPKDTRADYDALVKEYDLENVKPPPQPLPIERAMELLVKEKGAARPTTAPAPRQPR